MTKRIATGAALAATLILALGASTAQAAITITQAPAGQGYQNLTPYPQANGACFGTTDGRDSNGNPNGTYSLSSGRPIRLQFGWGARTDPQMRQFFKYSHGSVSITGSDMFSDSWAGNPSSGTPFVTAQNIAWSQLESVTVTSPGGGKPSPGLASFYRGVLSLAPGTYILRQTYSMERPVQDGSGAYNGDLPPNTCTFTVTA